MRRPSTVSALVILASCTLVASSLSSPPPDSSTEFTQLIKKHHGSPLNSKSKFIHKPKSNLKPRQGAGTYEASPGDYPQIDGSDGTANNLTLLSAFKSTSTFFPLAMAAVVSTGILVCFFLISIVKACAHRKKFADNEDDHLDCIPELKPQQPSFQQLQVRRDWEDKKENFDSVEQEVDNSNSTGGNDRVLRIKSTASEFGLPKLPLRTHRGNGGNGGEDIGAKNARNLNKSRNQIISNSNSTFVAHPLSHHETVNNFNGSQSEQGTNYSDDNNLRSRSSSIDSYEDYNEYTNEPPSPKSPNNQNQHDSTSPRSPNGNNNFQPRSILSNGSTLITPPRPLYIPSPQSPASNSIKLPSPGSTQPPSFMASLQNTRPLDIPTTPTSPAYVQNTPLQHLPHLKFDLDLPPKSSKRFSAITTPLSNRFSFASSNWSFKSPPSRTG